MSWLFSRALVVAFSEAHSLDGEPCAQLNVTPTQHLFWRNGKPMEFSRLSRFGLTSQLLTDTRGEELLMWFRVDFLAKTSASLAQEMVSTESDRGSGRKWRGSFARFDLDSCSWKTAQCSLLEDSTEFSETWPKAGSMRNGECYLRPILEPRTSEKGSGFWPTPTCGGGGQTLPEGTTPTGQTPDGRKQTVCLERYVQQVERDLWPTPTASLGTKGGRVTPRKSREGGTLIEAVSARSMWATPTVKGNYNRKGLSAQSGDGLATQVGGRLNPDWVEWLMGWPIGWTALQPLAMDRFQEWQLQHSKC
jgi:hypothetical protein